METSGAKLKNEIFNNNRVVGLNDNLVTCFQGGEFEANNDGKVINMPAIANNAILNNQQVRVYRGIGDHEALHSRLTPLTQYNEIAKYCADANDPHNISMKVLNAMEDVRIERLGMQTHPGIQRNLQTMLDEMLRIQEEACDPSASAAFALPVAITWMGRERNGLHVELPEKLTAKLNVLKVIDGLDDLIQPDKFKDLLFVAATFMKDQLGNSTLMNYLDGVPVEKTKKEQEQQQGSNLGNAPDDIQESLKNIPCMAHGVSVALGNMPIEKYPYIVPPDSIEVVASKKEIVPIVVPYHIMAIGRSFAIALKSQLTNRKNATRHQNVLDKRKLVQAFQGKEKVWSKKNNYDRGFNTAVSFLVDHSGSMRSNIEHVMQLTASLGLAVQSVNVPFEVTGFSTRGYKYDGNNEFIRVGNFHLIEYSRFNERIDLKRLSSALNYTKGYTPDTEALELGVQRMSLRPEKRKIIIILTDGNSDAGKESVCIDGARTPTELIFKRHRLSVLAQAKNEGIEVYAVMVGEGFNLDDYKPENVVLVPNFNELDNRLFQLFFNVIAEAGK